jgi:hypothetical protein
MRQAVSRTRPQIYQEIMNSAVAAIVFVNQQVISIRRHLRIINNNVQSITI